MSIVHVDADDHNKPAPAALMISMQRNQVHYRQPVLPRIYYSLKLLLVSPERCPLLLKNVDVQNKPATSTLMISVLVAGIL